MNVSTVGSDTRSTFGDEAVGVFGDIFLVSGGMLRERSCPVSESEGGETVSASRFANSSH